MEQARSPIIIKCWVYICIHGSYRESEANPVDPVDVGGSRSTISTALMDINWAVFTKGAKLKLSQKSAQV